MYSKPCPLLRLVRMMCLRITSARGVACRLAVIMLSALCLPIPAQAFSPKDANAVRLGAYRFPGQYLVPNGELATLQRIRSNLNPLESAFYVVPGLSNPGCVSFRSARRPNHYLRHQNYLIKLHEIDGSQLFRDDATFCPKAGLANSAHWSLESVNYPGHFIKQRGGTFLIDMLNAKAGDLADATFRKVVVDCCAVSGTTDSRAGVVDGGLNVTTKNSVTIRQVDGGWSVDATCYAPVAGNGRRDEGQADRTMAGAKAIQPEARPAPEPDLAPQGERAECCAFRGAIDSQAGWVDTGLDVTTKNSVTIRQVGGGWSVDAARYAPVGGNGHRDESRTDLGNWVHLKAYPRAHFGALIGSIDRSDVFLVGAGYRNMPPASGRLYLRINDGDSALGDNRGALIVEVQVE